MRHFITVLAVLVTCTFAGAADRPLLKLNYETGFLSVLDHKVQFSENNTYLDYRTQGGQDVLFAVTRYTLTFRPSAKHGLMLLYQPLRLETRGIIQDTDTVTIDNQKYTSADGLNCLYSFPFYRASYLYYLSDSDAGDLAIGFSLQIRNAVIEFTASDGSNLRSNGGIGPVPAFKVLLNRYPGSRYWWGFEADGMYAPVSYINGSDDEIVGAILDASLRGGIKLADQRKVFLNLRYLGGGAVGTDNDNPGPGDGYVKNWLHFLTVTVGFELGMM